MSTETHDFTVEIDYEDGGFVGWCSCSWSSPPQRSRRRALDLWENHCDQVFIWK